MEKADVSYLIADFEHRDILVRYRAARELGRMGARAVPHLIDALRQGSVFVEWALFDIGPPAVRPLCGILYDDEWVTRWTAARILGCIGDAAAALPLCRLLDDEVAPVRERAAEALVRIGTVEAAPFLVRALADESDVVRTRAGHALERIGRGAVEPLLAKAREGRVPAAVVEILGRIGDARAVPLLGEALRDRDWRVRRQAAQALGRLRDRRSASLLALTLRDAHRGVRRAAAEGLAAVGDGGAVLPLCDALTDADGGVRLEAAVALARIASRDPVPELQSAIPLLEEQLPPWSLGTPEALGVYREALAVIRAATAARKHLPLPALREAAAESLPRPAPLPGFDGRLLPRPSLVMADEPRLERPSGWRRLALWARRPMRRD